MRVQDWVKIEYSRLSIAAVPQEWEIRAGFRKEMLSRALQADSLEEFVNAESLRLLREPLMRSDSVLRNALNLIRYEVERKIIDELREKLTHGA